MVDHSPVQGRSTPAKKPKTGARWFNIVSTVLILFLCVVLVLLVLQNRRYKAMLVGSGSVPPEDALKPGEMVGDFAITTLEGEEGRLTVSTPDERYLLFVLSTSCPHCLANLPKWAEISRRLGGSGWYVVGVSMEGADETARYVRENRVGFYTVSTPDSAFMERYKLPGVPATLLLSTGGVVRGVWIGELTEEQVSEVLSQASS